MRVRITKKGIYSAEGEIPVGTELELEKEPTGWAGRYDVIRDDADEEAELVVNEELTEEEVDEMSREDVMKELTAREVEFKKNASNDDLAQLLKDELTEE